MAAVHAEIAATIQLVELARDRSVQIMRAYYVAASRYEWDEAERLRIECSALMESSLDLIGAMYRRFEQAGVPPQETIT